MEKKTTNVVKSNEKNITFKVCAATIANEYNKIKEDFDKMNSSEIRELSIRRHIEENGFISIPVEENIKVASKKRKDEEKGRSE